MLRKGISKTKILSDLNMMMKRGKIAGKAAIHNHHHHHRSAAVQESEFSYPVPLNEYEFSCSNSPTYFSTFRRLPFHLNKRKSSQSPPPQISENEILEAAWEMASSVGPSPALPGFGRTPMVRQLRVTDSPFPLTGIEEDNNHVDEAAEKFISKFYSDLKSQI